MRTFPIEVHYKVIEILVVRWLGTKANADFQRDYYKRRKLAGRSPGNDDEDSILSFLHKLNIVLVSLRTRLECCTPLKKALFCSLKADILKKFAAALLSIFFLARFALRAAQHGLYTSNLLPTSMQYQVYVRYITSNGRLMHLNL